MKLRDYTPGCPKVILLGPPGSGKTLLATTLGHRAKVLDINNGLASAKLFKDKFTAERQECEVVNCWDSGSPDTVWARTVKEIRNFTDKPSHPALIIDGLTDLAEAALGNVLLGAGKWGEESASSVEQREWGQAIMMMQRLMYRIKSCQAVVVLVAHTATAGAVKREFERLSVYGRNLRPAIAGLFDETWYQKVSGFGTKKTFTLQAVTSGTVECKTRRQLPDGSDVNLGMVKLLELTGFTFEKEKGATSGN